MTTLGTRLAQKLALEVSAKPGPGPRSPLIAEADREPGLAIKKFFDEAKQFFVRAVSEGFPSKEIFMQLGGVSSYEPLRAWQVDKSLTQLSYAGRTVVRPHPVEHLTAAKALRTALDVQPPRNAEGSASLDFGPCNILWNDFQAWAQSEGLTVYWKFGHDGVGLDSWWQLRIQPNSVS